MGKRLEKGNMSRLDIFTNKEHYLLGNALAGAVYRLSNFPDQYMNKSVGITLKDLKILLKEFEKDRKKRSKLLKELL